MECFFDKELGHYKFSEGKLKFYLTTSDIIFMKNILDKTSISPYITKDFVNRRISYMGRERVFTIPLDSEIEVRGFEASEFKTSELKLSEQRILEILENLKNKNL